MCGLAGIFAYHYASLPVDRIELNRMRERMISRGPDGAGEWYSPDGRVGLAHRRLSIIDLSERGSQPMLSPDGSLAVVFNGEIYNYRELRDILRKGGKTFYSDSDTEVLLQLYDVKGEAMLQDLRGMFAFALWDGRKKKFLLARDPYGIKPLYYADDGWTVRVASQVKAILAGGKVSRDTEPAGAVGFFLMGSVPEPFSLYQEIRAVPAGSFVWIDETGPAEPQQYFSIAEIFLQKHDAEDTAESDVQNTVREALQKSVQYHFVSDVPVGIFLSAGIDSGTLVALARDAGIRDIKTFTLAFDEYQNKERDEAPVAAEVAQFYETEHIERRITQQEFRAGLPHILQNMDQPTIDGINTYFVSKISAETGLKVALSGVGGDELFGGYDNFETIPRWVRSLALPSRIPLAGDMLRLLCSSVLLRPRLPHPKFPGLLKYGGSYAGVYFLRRSLFLPWELKNILDKETLREGLCRLGLIEQIRSALGKAKGSPFARVATMESSFYLRNQLLRDTDWAGMAHSLEVRTPYVDAFLLRSIGGPLARRPGFFHKDLLARSPRRPLAEKIQTRKKTGFGIPVDTWLESEKNLDTWKAVPLLREKTCPWYRKWAYAVYRNAIESV